MRRAIIFAAAIFCCCAAARGQSAPKAAPAGGGEAAPRLSRWVDLQAATVNLYYFYADNWRGDVTYNQMRHKEVVRGRFKFDARGRYSVNASLSSGQSFTGSLNNTGIGRGTWQKRLSLRQLFFAARPTEWLELQAGGLGFTRGESTEATTYDDDGFLTGYRVTVRRPRKLYFDEVSLTGGYLGDYGRLNATGRMRRLGNFNYFQVQASKRFEGRASASADFTTASGVGTVRGAVRLNVGRSRVLDSVRLEGYRRLDFKSAGGYVVRGERLLAKGLTAGGGFARIDRAYGGLNADRFPAGKRLFATASYQLRPELSLNFFASRAVANSFAQPTRTRLDLFVSYDVLKVMRKAGWL